MTEATWRGEEPDTPDSDHDHFEDARRTPLLFAKFRAANGSMLDLPVLDISAAGCLVQRTFRALHEGERVLIRLPGLTFMPAQVVWVEETTAGITFEHALHEAILAHLKGSGARSRLS